MRITLRVHEVQKGQYAMNKAKKVEFSFGWLALKLLGKSLYSNAWSAISELVANGFDAHANEVYIFLDVRCVTCDV